MRRIPVYGPMEGNNWSSAISIAGRPVDTVSPDGSSWNRVGPRYFETVGTRLRRGRVIEEGEITGGARVAVINDAFRGRFFVHLRTQVTREQHEGRARSAPVQHLQFD